MAYMVSVTWAAYEYCLLGFKASRKFMSQSPAEAEESHQAGRTSASKTADPAPDEIGSVVNQWGTLRGLNRASKPSKGMAGVQVASMRMRVAPGSRPESLGRRSE